MRKLLSLFVAALFSVTMFAADSYTAAGSSAVLFGKTWDAAVVANDLSLLEGTTYQLVKEGVELPAATIQFKICEDHKWDKAYPASNYDLVITESGIYDVTITFDASKGNEGVSAAAVKKGEAVVVPSVAIKGSWDAKGAYDATWNGGAAYDFEIAEDKKTASYACTLTSLTDYNFGLEIGGAWCSNGAITIDREHSSVNFVAGSGNAKLTVDAAGEYTFTWTYETETLSVTFPEKGEDPEPEKVLPVVALAGTMNGWNATANVLTPAKDSLSASVVVELEAGKDTLKIVSDGKWLGKSNNEGLYSMHREWNHVDHFDLINSAEGNVELVADVAGEYTFTWTYADSTLVVTFPAAPFVPEPEYFLVRASNEWAVVEADKFAATATEGEFKLAATLVLDDEIKVLGIAGEDSTWYPDGMGNAFEITEKFTGEHDIYFRPAGNDDWKSFHEGGFFWMGANPDPEPELKDLFLVPNQWANEDAKIAAWYWKKGEGGEWTSFLAPKAEGNDTLVAKVNVEADSIIFVRFSAAQEAPAWMGPNQLNQTANDSIQWAKAVCTILPGGGYESKATWDVYVPEPKGKYYIIGDAGIVGSEEKAWQPDGIKAMKDTTVLSIKAGSYSMRLTLDGTWEGGQKDYRNLSEITPGLGEYVDDYSNHNITFTLDADGEVTVIYIAAHDEEPEVFKVLGNFHVAKNGYFLLGTINSWTPAAEYLFTENPGQAGEYVLENVTLTAGDSIKVARVANDVAVEWFGNNNYGIDANHAGVKTVYFRTVANDEWKSDDPINDGFIYIEPNESTGVEETAVQGKAVKALRDGQLVIIKNGVRYNVIGIRF